MLSGYIVFRNKFQKPFGLDVGLLCIVFPMLLGWRPKLISVVSPFVFCFSTQGELRRQRDIFVLPYFGNRVAFNSGSKKPIRDMLDEYIVFQNKLQSKPF